MKLLHIAVCGYYGRGNFGDELFLKTFQQIFASHKVIGRKDLLDESQIDAVIIGGGDLITPYFFNNNYFPPAFARHPTWIYGVGIVDAYAPVEAETARYREVTSKAKAFVVRDNHSADIAKALALHPNIEVAPDVVFSYEQPNYPFKPFSNRKSIGICIHAYSERPLEIITLLASQIDLSDYHLVLIPMIDQASNPYSDVLPCRKLFDKLAELDVKVSIFDDGYDLETTYSIIQNLDLLISFKLHPSLVALRNLVPVLCFSDQSKVKSLLDNFNLSEFHSATKTGDEILIQKMKHLLKHGQESFQTISSKVTKAQQTSTESLLKLKHSIETEVKH